MTYQLTWRDFTAYIAARGSTGSGKRAEAESLARTYVWKRFARCNDPLIDSSIYPKAEDCAPAEFQSREHWDSSYKALIHQRENDVRRSHDRFYSNHVTLVPHANDADARNPLNEILSSGSSADDSAVFHLEVEQLRDCVRNEFDTDFTCGPEVREAILDFLDAVESNDFSNLDEAIKDGLKQQLPEVFDGSQRGRKALERAIKRARERLAVIEEILLDE